MIRRWFPLVILAAAQFVMVLDSSVMNVSISQIVADLDTTVTGVQGAITVYTLVMAAFMLVGAKLGDISVALLALLSFLFTRRLPDKPSTAEQRPHPRPDPRDVGASNRVPTVLAVRPRAAPAPV